MKKEEQLWLRVDMDDDWQAVIPNPDDEPHSKLILIDGDEKTGELAGYDCPCKPEVDFKNKVITHNSFRDGKSP